MQQLLLIISFIASSVNPGSNTPTGELNNQMQDNKLFPSNIKSGIHASEQEQTNEDENPKNTDKASCVEVAALEQMEDSKPDSLMVEKIIAINGNSKQDETSQPIFSKDNKKHTKEIEINAEKENDKLNNGSDDEEKIEKNDLKYENKTDNKTCDEEEIEQKNMDKKELEGSDSISNQEENNISKVFSALFDELYKDLADFEHCVKCISINMSNCIKSLKELKEFYETNIKEYENKDNLCPNNFCNFAEINQKNKQMWENYNLLDKTLEKNLFQFEDVSIKVLDERKKSLCDSKFFVPLFTWQVLKEEVFSLKEEFEDMAKSNLGDKKFINGDIK